MRHVRSAACAIAGLLLAFAPQAGRATVVCNPAGSTNCFDFQCLPVDPPSLGPIQVPDTELCLKPLQVAQSATTRDGALRMLASACVKNGGKLKDGGKKVTCSIPVKAHAAASTGTRAGCEAGGGVWDGGDGKGGCTRRRK